jgi:ribosomal protein S12 methylthiotransferase accessory factor
MYGRDTLRQALALFSQDERFFGLTHLGGNFEGSAIHQRLLEAYRKVRG